MTTGDCIACGALLIVQEVKPRLCRECAKTRTLILVPRIGGPDEIWLLMKPREASA